MQQSKRNSSWPALFIVALALSFPGISLFVVSAKGERVTAAAAAADLQTQTNADARAN
jgi:hypothetical protein